MANNGTIQLQEGEKLTPVMIYTQNMLVWGEVVTVEAIRVSTWLRNQSVPTYINIINVQVLTFDGGAKPRPYTFKELHLPTSQVIALHIKPPDRDPLDYDPNEPNRKMVPLTVMVGPFRFDGSVRMSTHTTLDRFLDVSKVTFTALYDVEITQPSVPAMGIIRVPFAVVRSESVLFATRAG
jgi:hypothetical protein